MFIYFFPAVSWAHAILRPDIYTIYILLLSIYSAWPRLLYLKSFYGPKSYITILQEKKNRYKKHLYPEGSLEHRFQHVYMFI